MAGTLDKSFGKGGYTLSDFGGNLESTPNAQVIDSNNCTIVTGFTGTNFSDKKLYIAKYTSTGVLDKTFGRGKGYILGDYYTGQPSEGKSLVIDSNGNIIVTGSANNDEGAQRLLLAKYYSNGEIYKDFGGGKGWITSDFGYSSKDYFSYGISLALDRSGLIIVGGNIFKPVSETAVESILAGYDTDGNLDKDFGGNGTGWSNITNSDINGDSFSKIVIENTGSIIVLVQIVGGNNSAYDPAIITKFNSEGVLDKNFGGDKGYILIKDGSKYSGINEYCDIVLDGSNHIIFTSKDEYTGDLLLVSYNSSDGFLDRNFGENRGYTITKIPNYDSAGYSLVIDSNNRIIVTGNVNNTDQTIVKTLLARYSSEGKLDKTFGGQGLGYSITSFGDINKSLAYAISLDNNGLIIVSGLASLSTGVLVSFIARYFNENNEPICLPAGTPILTDQGLVAIEKIDTKKHTINHKRIVAITTTISPEKHLVCFEANSMGINCPTQRTLMTPGHEVLYKGKLVQSKHFVGRLTGVHTVPYNGKDVLYNVLQEQHGLMRVNNMVLETLHPENKVAREILMGNNH
jgi:uncharacterized delta-60 repeat protein